MQSTYQVVKRFKNTIIVILKAQKIGFLELFPALADHFLISFFIIALAFSLKFQ